MKLDIFVIIKVGKYKTNGKISLITKTLIHYITLLRKCVLINLKIVGIKILLLFDVLIDSFPSSH